MIDPAKPEIAVNHAGEATPRDGTRSSFNPQPKVVFCTTQGDAAHIRAALDAGADEYLIKPFDRETMEMKFEIAGVA